MHAASVDPPLHPLLRLWAWAGGASLLYLVSAACILAGTALVLAPLAGLPDAASEFFALVGSLHCYLAALVAVALLICRWRHSLDDAVSVTVLAALFAVAAPAALDTVAIDRPRLTLASGLAGLALLAGVRLALARVVLGPWPRLVDGALIALALLNGVLPGVFGLLLGPDRQTDLRWLWWLAWYALIAAGGVIALAAARVDAAGLVRGLPVLRGSGLRWTVALLVFPTSAAHLGLLGWTFSTQVQAGDLLAVAVVLALAGCELRRAFFPRLPGLDSGIALAVGAAAVAVTLGGWHGQAAAWSPGLIAYPPLLLAALAAGLVAAAWRHGRDRLLVTAALPALAAVLLWGSTPAVVALNWTAAGLAALLALLLWAWRRRNPDAAVLAALLAAIGLSASPWGEAVVGPTAAARLALFAVAGGGFVLLIACAAGRALAPSVVALAGWWLGLGALALCFPERAPLHAPLSAGLAVAALSAAAWWRTRLAWLALPGSAPLVAASGLLVPAGWLAIAASFALLAVGAALSRRRAQRGAAGPPTDCGPSASRAERLLAIAHRQGPPPAAPPE